jgi:hypothetical protein
LLLLLRNFVLSITSAILSCTVLSNAYSWLSKCLGIAAAKPAAPQVAPLAYWQAPKEVTTDADKPGKEAVKVAIDADRLYVSSPEKRQVPCSTAPFREMSTGH